MKKFLIAAIVLILLTPIGLLAPGSAWGEWGLDEIKSMVGYIPSGMKHFSDTIKVILPDYSIPGFDKNFFQLSIGYIFSAVVGIAIIALVFFILSKIMGKSEEKNE
ncbi:PDGLE domain-containing protein [Thermoanaerobacterium thermosaccharolyticum]|uniref:PDGLE domain-containing protein n=1 Tax=Thermoanaerobacterium thermosaccharolyticum TaxID=1517 RepID=UPI00177CA6D0|nr:cobalamin biosynthesis protein [Thermoanaerobacterium thermosaccharolyticum]MBE0228678.1 cobalamin biosynthesis protein [Thermoanaerobacterium thermosaccharolyticum]